MESVQVRSPIDGAVMGEVARDGDERVAQVVDAAHKAQRLWAALSLQDRMSTVRRGVEGLSAKRELIARQLAVSMGRPIRFGQGEVGGFVERANYMLGIAEDSLADVVIEEGGGAERMIKCPLGVVLIIGAWNYPFLVVVNTLIPALLAGNAVIIKHASQTPFAARELCTAFASAGLPPSVLSSLQLSNEATERLVGHPLISSVNLVGSVRAGRAVSAAVARRSGDFIPYALELGGCDAAYVRFDCNLEKAAASLADGAFFNSGQSCCGIQRILVHSDVYSDFVRLFTEATCRDFILGNPLEESTTLGPLVSEEAAAQVRAAIQKDIARGARNIAISNAKSIQPGGAYMEPAILVDVPINGVLLNEEVFGPVVAICRVTLDAEALKAINSTPYGLTASIWTGDRAFFEDSLRSLSVGTVFANRYPALAWSGTKNSGIGCSLSRFGFDSVTRILSVNANFD